VTGWPPSPAGRHSPFGPAPSQRLLPYYGLFCPCAPHRYSGPRRVTRSAVFLGIGTTGSPVPRESLVQGHIAFELDAARAGLQGSARTDPPRLAGPGAASVMHDIGGLASGRS
jgi:hypothetical protein